MSHPRWRDEQGQLRPTRPCPKRGRVIPVTHGPAKPLPTMIRRPFQVLSFVEWCGHQQEVILVPDAPGWFREIPVLGEAR